MSVGLALVVSTEVRPLLELTIDACRRAKAGLAAGLDVSEQALRSVRQAGQFLDQVELQPGSSDGQTKLQVVTRQAGISRDTAWRWRRVGRVSDEDFEAYVEKKKTDGHPATIDGLICRPTTGRRDERYLHQLAVLAEKFGTKRGTATVKAAVKLAYDVVLAERCEQ